MQSNKFMRFDADLYIRRHKSEISAILGYLAITAIFFWPLVAGISSFIPGTGGDTYQSAWELWWVSYSILSLHTSPYFTYFIYFPIGANLLTQTMAPLAGILSAPFEAFGSAVALNIVFIAGFVLSGFFMYIFAYYLTRNRYASFLAGAIYAFSPMHVFQSFGHLQWINIEWIPLFFMFLIIALKEKKHKYALYAALSFIFLTFMGDLEQSIAVSIGAVVLLASYYLTNDRRSIYNRRSLIYLAEIAVAIFILGSPVFISIIIALQHGILSTVNAVSSTQANILYSPDVLSFFVPSLMNPLLGFIPNALNYLYASDPTERTVYIGYSVIFLALVSIYDFRSRKSLKSLAPWIIPAVIFLILSIGPYLQVNGAVISSVPMPYLLLHKIPILNVFREPGRFDIMFELFISVLAAFGFIAISKNKIGPLRTEKGFFVLFLVLVLFEYSTTPISNAQLQANYGNAYIPAAYKDLGNATSNFSIITLPALPYYYSSSPELYPGIAMYYQTASRKPLIGGYATRSNNTQLELLSDIPMATASEYLQYGQNLSYFSPITENYTKLNTFWLANYRTKYVTVIRGAYNDTELPALLEYLYGMFGQPVYQSNTTDVFQTSGAISKGIGSSLVSYTAGTWIPGFSLCQSSSCNATLSNMWWGNTTRGIIVYSPNQTSASMRFDAISAYNDSILYLYTNGNLAHAFNLTGTAEAYSANITIKPGLNSLILYYKQNAYVVNDSILNFGIENITLNRTS